MEVTTFTLLKDNSKVRVKISEQLIKLIKGRINKKFGSITNFSKNSSFTKDSLVYWLAKEPCRTNIPIPSFIPLITNLNILITTAKENIKSYSTKGCHSTVNLPKKISIDKDFFKGVGLYVGDGYTSNKLPRIVFINTEPSLIKYFIAWLKEYLEIVESDLYATIYCNPYDKRLVSIIKRKRIKHKLYKTEKPHHKSSCKIFLNNAVYRYLLDSLIELSRRTCSKNKKFAVEYLKGIMAAEGCIYLPKARVPTLFIEMHIGKNIEHVKGLLNFLKINYLNYARPLNRTKLVIYRNKELKKFNDMDIFEIYPKKKRKLTLAICNSIRKGVNGKP